MKINKLILPGVIILCSVSIVIMIVALTAGNKSREGFTPPSFDSAAVQGIPDVPDDLGYSPVEAAAFTVYLCGNVIADGNTADVYFTSADINTVWLKLRILDADGETIGETGLIKAGEYVKSVNLTKIPADGAAIKSKIMAYEPETYYSAGSAALNTTLRIGG